MILLILSGNCSKAPYVNYYRKYGSLRIIEWNRIGEIGIADSSYEYLFNEEFSGYLNTIKAYISYARFVKSCLKQSNEKNIVIFNVVNYIFISIICYSEIKGKNVIFDMRDFSTGFRYYKALLKFLLYRHTTLNVYSSKKFREEMGDSSGLIVHNIPNFETTVNPPVELKRISTIGSIRDLEENFQVAYMACNFEMVKSFYGEGPCSYNLEVLCKNKGLPAKFYGRFNEGEKLSILDESDIINNYNRNDFNGSRLMSNRFYMAVFSGKPQIVNKQTYQGEVAIAAGVGFDLFDLENYVSSWSSEKSNQFSDKCRLLIDSILNDNIKSDLIINEFID